MTGDDIIRANPEFRYEHATIAGLQGLKGTDPASGNEVWCIYCANSHVAAPGPWDENQIKVAAAQLSASVGGVDRGHYLTRPTNQGPLR